MASNQYPTFSSIKKETKNYPTLSQINQSQSGDIRYDAQGSNIQNQSLQKGVDYLDKSTDPMYDINYNSESVKKYNQPNKYPQNPNQNLHNNMPNYSLNNSDYLDGKYDSGKAKEYNPNVEINGPKQIYGNPEYNKDLDTNYNSSPLAMEQYYKIPMSQPPYDYVVPHGPGIFPQFPHHPVFPHFGHPHFPPNYYLYEGDYYAYC